MPLNAHIHTLCLLHTSVPLQILETSMFNDCFEQVADKSPCA